jgi:arylsulfatase A-like enzyme
MLDNLRFLVCLASLLVVSTIEAKQPNILLILTDQHHSNMLSCAGNPYLKTKALDAMAKSGIRFSEAYVTNPVCVPSRISLATGRMAGRLGVFYNGQKAEITKNDHKNSLGMLVKSAGYDTFYGGKTHLPKELNPLNAGYDEYFKNDREELSKACIEFMTKKRDNPFFAVASFINPHDICFAYNAKTNQSKGKAQLEVKELLKQAEALDEKDLPDLPKNHGVPKLEPEAVDSSLKTKAVTPAKTIRKSYSVRDWRNYRWMYCRLTEKVDAQIGILLNALKEHKLEENTLVIFTSDHGDMDGHHQLASKNVFYENSVKVPFIMQYKGAIPGDQLNQVSLVSNGLDVLPTICDYAGVKIPEHLLGQSARALAEGQSNVTWRDYVVSENPNGRMLRSGRYKYCVYDHGKIRESLINLKKDPGEMNNLALSPEYETVLKEHRSYLQEWIKVSKDKEAQSFAIP